MISFFVVAFFCHAYASAYDYCADCKTNGYSLVQEDMECTTANDKELAAWKICTIEQCAQLCQEIQDCKHFLVGKGPKVGRCFWDYTEHQQSAIGCDKWETDDYDFYRVCRGTDVTECEGVTPHALAQSECKNRNTTAPKQKSTLEDAEPSAHYCDDCKKDGYSLVKERMECITLDDMPLGITDTARECALLCQQKVKSTNKECNHFTFGPSSGQCGWENTVDETNKYRCKEWQTAKVNFYQICSDNMNECDGAAPAAIDGCRPGGKFRLKSKEADVRAAFLPTDFKWIDNMTKMLGNSYTMQVLDKDYPEICVLSTPFGKLYFPLAARAANKCTCSNGATKTGVLCTVDGTEQCARCDEKHTLINGKCAKNKVFVSSTTNTISTTKTTTNTTTTTTPTTTTMTTPATTPTAKCTECHTHATCTEPHKCVCNEGYVDDASANAKPGRKCIVDYGFATAVIIGVLVALFALTVGVVCIIRCCKMQKYSDRAKITNMGTMYDNVWSTHSSPKKAKEKSISKDGKTLKVSR